MDWVLLSCIAMIFSAMMALINQYTKVSGFRLAIWFKVILCLPVLPIVLFVGLPTDPIFYICVICTAPLGIIGDKYSFNVAAKYGGGVVSRLLPLHVLLIFGFWLIVNPSLFSSYFENIWVGAGIVLSLIGIAFFSNKMRKCEISYQAFKEIAPAIIAYAITPVIGKIAFDHSDLHQGVYAYIFLQAVTTTIIGLPILAHQQKKQNKPMITYPIFKASMIVSVCVFLHLVTKNYAFSIVDDPTFPVAIIMASPLFILLFYKLTNHKEEANIWAGIGIVLSIIILVILKSL